MVHYRDQGVNIFFKIAVLIIKNYFVILFFRGCFQRVVLTMEAA